MTVSAPGKDPRRLIHDAEGWNSGPRPDLLTDPVTPTGLFFTRSHAPVPAIDPAAYRLRVTGLVRTPLELALADLARFTRRDVVATLVCAGVRRRELETVQPVPGELPWGPEAISTGAFSGVRLREVLDQAGVADGATHVEFIGLDRVERGGNTFGFGGSVPLAKARSDEVLLADALNRAPLPPEHGFPLRALVPGFYGARSVKWLGEIVLRDGPSNNYFQAQAYRVLRTPDPVDPRDVRGGTELGPLPLNAAISDPGPGETRVGKFFVAGWATGPGGDSPARVEISADDGSTWITCVIMPGEKRFAWRQWKAFLTLPPGTYTIMVRAFDAEGATQPADLAEVWNVKGYGNNAWHRIQMTVKGQ